MPQEAMPEEAMPGEAILGDAMPGEAICEMKSVFRYCTSISFNKLF